MAGFTNNILGPIKKPNFQKDSVIIAELASKSPDTYDKPIARFGFAASSTEWKRSVQDPNNTCGYRIDCASPDTRYPFGTMANNSTFYKKLFAPADSWITIQFRQNVPPPGIQLVVDTDSVEITTIIKSVKTGAEYKRTIIDTQSIIGRPTKRVIPPMYDAMEEFDATLVDIEVVMTSSGLIFEHYIDDIIIEYGPGYCNLINCLDTFTGNEPTPKYLNMTKQTLALQGPSVLNFGTRYYIPAGKTAEQTFRLNGYLNKNAKISIAVSAYSTQGTKGVRVILQTFDERQQPLEGFSDRLEVTHKEHFLKSNTYDNGVAVDNYTTSMFTLGQPAKILKVLIQSDIEDLHIGFIDICTDQDVTLEVVPPSLDCKGNVNDLKVYLSINGIPREEINLFQAFCRYSILTNTTYRSGTAIAVTPTVDGRIGTELPAKCNDSKLCNYWKQQGINNAVTQTVLPKTIINNGIEANPLEIVDGTFNNLRKIDNWVWAAPLSGGFAPDQYILQFGKTPNNLAEDNFVEAVEIFLSMNRLEVANSDCQGPDTGYDFANYIQISSEERLLKANIPAIGLQSPKSILFRKITQTKVDGVTVANYVQVNRFCDLKYVLTGGFSVEHHLDDGEYFIFKAYDWSRSPNTIFDTRDECGKYLDYANFYTMGCYFNDRQSIVGISETVIKPDNYALSPAGIKYWTKRISQSSSVNLFTKDSVGLEETLRLLRTQSTTEGQDFLGKMIWDDKIIGSNEEEPAAEPNSLCNDPADELAITIEYKNVTGIIRRFTKTMALEDILKLDTVNSEDWNQLKAYGNGVPGDFAMWNSIKFVIDAGNGQGFDQCLTPIVVTEYKGTSQANTFPAFDSFAKGTFFPNCTPEVKVFESVPGFANNEIQSLVLPTATDGFYTVSFDYRGTSSVDVPYNADAEGLKASLAGLSNIGTTDSLSVSGKGTTSEPFIIEFIGRLSLSPLPLLTISTTELKCVTNSVVTTLNIGTKNERQRIVKTSDSRAPLILKYDGYVTANIPYNASLNAMQAALSLIPALGKEVLVSGNIIDRDAPYTGPWDIDFIGSLAGNSMPSLMPIVIGYQQQLLWSGSVGTNTKQSIKINATSGSFRLTLYDIVNGVTLQATTDPIPYNAFAEEIVEAITTSISFLSATDLSVSKVLSTATETEWTIEFIGTFAGIAVPKITIDATLLYRTDNATLTRTQVGLGIGERQRISLFQVTGGFYYLSITIKGVTEVTDAIPYDATDIKMQEVISRLGFFEDGDVIIREEPLEEGEYKAYTFSFGIQHSNVELIVPLYSGFLICNPAIQIPGPPYDYEIPVCKQNPLDLTNVKQLEKPCPNDGVSPLPVDCCTIEKAGDNTVNFMSYQRELVSPNTKIDNKLVTIKQLAAIKRIPYKDFNVYIRDFRTNTIREASYDATIMSNISLVFIEKEVDTDAGQREIMTHLANSQELLPTRTLISTANEASILKRNKIYG